MKQTLLLLVLALGICSINVSAQTKKQNTTKHTSATRSTQQNGQVMKFRQVAEDGYVWYKLKRGNLYGARDAEGNNIIPIKYNEVSYFCYETHWFRVKKGEYEGAYTRQGTQVVSPERHYTNVNLGSKGGNIYWTVRKNGKTIVLDAKGKEIFSLDCDHLYMTSSFDDGSNYTKVYYFQLLKENEEGSFKGICDLNGNIICPPVYEWCVLKKWGKILEREKEGKRLPNESINYSASTHFNYSPYEELYYVSKTTSSEPSASPSTNNSHFSNNIPESNSENKTTTIVVEHHRDPIPVQEWQQCTNCWGEGKVMCLGACGGTGTYYVGDRLHICNSCGGKGKKICPNCGGQGGKYVTVYR